MLGELPQEGTQEKNYFVSAYVSLLRNDDKTYYLACPGENCHKKVVEESIGWRCEACNKTYTSCVPTYMLTAKLADVSEALYVTFYW